jgi:two-component system, OmpR family, sensor kinase
LSLRSRLLISVVLLFTIALVVAAAAIYGEQRSYLYGHLDQRVVAAAAPISYVLGIEPRLLSGGPAVTNRAGVGHAVVSPLGRGLAGFVPSGTFGEFVGNDGRVRRGPVLASYGEKPPPRPAIPERILNAQPNGSPRLFTVSSTPRSHVRFRVAAVALDSGAGTIIVAVPLREVDQTLDELVIVEALVVAAVLIVLVGLAWAVIRVSLRPLDQIGRVAGEITEGDLGRRVSPATPRTEVGRLGLSLNLMLVRLEEAFADRARSEEVRRQFLADASHELRTPLASIRGYAELFRLGPARDPAALERAMARIESEAARMGKLVDDLMLLARLDELPESPRDVIDLSELAAHAVTDARAMAPARTVTLRAPASVCVLGDVDGLRQVLANLLSNAVIHTPDDAPVEVRVFGERGTAVVEVGDHGSGLPPGAEDHVFERFWRADEGRTRGPGGSGLGLSIVREIVDAHGGSVSARNRHGRGAVFTVRLPMYSADSQDSPGTVSDTGTKVEPGCSETSVLGLASSATRSRSQPRSSPSPSRSAR